MNKELLIKANKEIKKSRPVLRQNTACDYFRDGTFLEIAFISKRCKNDAAGSCVMCDYGTVNGVKSCKTYLAEMDCILKKERGIQYLLLCTNGGIMDFSQIPESTFWEILKYINKTNIPNIILETHYCDISHRKLQKTKEILNSKNITIELGLETVNQTYQDYLIMKHIEMQKFEKTVYIIQNYGFSVDLNILIGLPFLSEREQLQDTRESMIWAFQHSCNVVVFPINIKPFTLLMNMYENGYYEPVSHWLLLLLLDSLETELLSQVVISYYGNRDENYYLNGNKAILPNCCPVCIKSLMDFYDSFGKEDNPYQKKQLLNQILGFDKCDCLKKQKRQLDLPDDNNFEVKYNLYSNFLKYEFFSEKNQEF